MRFRLSSVALILVFFIQAFLVYDLRWKDGKWKDVIKNDGQGYYDPLPALFIRHDISQMDSSREFNRVVGHRVVNKYYIGTSLLMTPFFASGYLGAKAGGYTVDGYSKPFQLAVSLAALAYLLLGLFFLRGSLQVFGIPDRINACILFLVCYGTNLIHYSIMEPGMSHVYSFFTVCLFIWSALGFFRQNKPNALYPLAFSYALILLIRPVNGIVILSLYFFAGSFSALGCLIRSRKILLFSFLLFLGITSIQLFLWHTETGHWLVWSYPGEGFYFLHPQVLNVLFSFKKGFFLYTPLAALALCGFIPLWKKYKSASWGLAGTLIAALYVISSWWSWSYAGSFSQRAFVEYLPFLGILLAHALHSRWVQACALLCLGLNLVQHYQYRHGILDPNYMNKGKYLYTFLHTGKEWEGKLGGIQDDRPYSPYPPELIGNSENDPKANKDLLTTWQPGSGDLDTSRTLDLANREYSTALEFPLTPFPYPFSRLYLEIHLSRFERNALSSQKALVVMAITGRDQHVNYYYATLLNDYPGDVCCTWRSYNYTLDTPALMNPENKLGIYIWNREKGDFKVRDFKAKVWGIRQ